MAAGRGLGTFSLLTATLAPYYRPQESRSPEAASSPAPRPCRPAGCRLHVWGAPGCVWATWRTLPGGAGLQEPAAGERSVGVNEKPRSRREA